MSNTGWIVIGFVLCVTFVLASRHGTMRIEKENNLKRLEVELALKKEENKRLEIMSAAISEARKTR